ncbi:MAG: PorV/PorQ family protein [Bacteroidota bacterium]|nr:PorV/PorQ family protein [Bacteroidota bacterium]
MTYFLRSITIFFSLLYSGFIFAGNPDRQGEAGAYELIMNPWARCAGLNNLNTSFIGGVEAMFVNTAGLSRINRTQIALGHTRWFVPSGVNINAFGLAQKIGKSGTLGISLMALDFGDIRVTTTAVPEGTGATYSPSFFNLGVGYAHSFANKVSVGILIRGVSEAIQDLNSFGFAIDAGVQYVAGEKDNFKLGISLRNVGSPMKFSGEGLSTQLSSDEGTKLTYDVRLSGYELPSLLHIGFSYDFIFTDNIKLTPVTNFTANSFGRDEIGVGVELAITELFALRGAYKAELGSSEGLENSAYTGLSAGATVSMPLKKKGDSKLSIDYAYRTTSPFQGTHNLGLRLDF